MPLLDKIYQISMEKGKKTAWKKWNVCNDASLTFAKLSHTSSAIEEQMSYGLIQRQKVPSEQPNKPELQCP